MNAAHRLRRRLRAALRPQHPVRQLPDGSDAVLRALVDELVAADIGLGALLLGDERDLDDIPGALALGERLAMLVRQVVDTPAPGPAGLAAKARAARLRSPEAGYDAALPLGLSLAADVLRLLNVPTRSAPLPLFRLWFSSPDDLGFPINKEGSAMTPSRDDAARRLAVLRHNAAWRTSVDLLLQIGVWSGLTAVFLPMWGVGLSWTWIVGLLAVSSVTVALGFWCLRFIDYSE